MTEPPPPDGFQRRNVRHGVDEGYHGTLLINQYAYSSYRDQELIQPKTVIYLTDDSDVFKAIDYATKHKLGIAIRAGVGSIQAYKDFTWDNAGHTQVTLGFSITLSRLQGKLCRKNRFLPTGQCSYVNLGGHLHTGGYGQLTHGFDLLADYVQKIRIITASLLEARWVDRNVDEDKKLFRAILSPGNFG
ncbi:FAD dependent oxidoreductase, partial [Podila epicladia]